MKLNKKEPRRILIYGATSALAQATSRIFAADGSSFFLIGRNIERLATIRADLISHGAGKVGVLAADADDYCLTKDQFLESAREFLGEIDLALITHGVLGDQKVCQLDGDAAKDVISTNFISAVYQLTYLANYFEWRRCGTIVVVTSVAGDRGRQSNYVYGSAKAGLAVFVQGLRNRLFAAGVGVIDVRPGFVATPMTAHLKQGFLFAEPATIGLGIYRAVERKRDIVYLPGFWRAILFIVKAIPETVFKRLKF